MRRIGLAVRLTVSIALAPIAIEAQLAVLSPVNLVLTLEVLDPNS